jgi:hypothetical protein
MDLPRVFRVLLATAILDSCTLQVGWGAEKMASVAVIVYSTTGTKISNPVIRLKSLEPTGETRTLSNGRTAAAAFGRYELIVSREGFLPVARQVEINHPALCIPVSLEIDSIADTFSPQAPQRDFVVVIKGLTLSEFTWAKLVAVYSDEQYATIIDGGRATFYSPRPGNYLLLILRGPSLLRTLEIRVTRSSDLETIELGN